MTDKFVLSEKEHYDSDEFGEVYIKEDVKEFIKKIKEDIWKIDLKTASLENRLPSIVLSEVQDIINHLAGKTLVEGKA